jgi:hypothetical protein
MGAVEDVAAILKNARSAPFLFVGSGLSRRYLQLPDWEGLLRSLASLTGRPYGYFVTAGNGEPGAVATAIAEVLQPLWWSDEAFGSSRDRWGEVLTTRAGPLKAEVAKIAEAAGETSTRDEVRDRELVLLSGAVIDGIITTNYDGLLERTFPEFKVFIGQDELLFTDPQGVGEIYKIHGDMLRPESIVLTSDDFSEYADRNPYLAAKLLTIFIEHPVIFLGYSLRDPNVTQILASIATVLTRDNLERLQDNLILVEWDPDIGEPLISPGLVSAGGFNIPVKVLKLPDFLDLFEALNQLERKFSATVLRRLKQHVYELVLSNEPSSRLHVTSLEDLETRADIDVVVGVGMEARLSDQGYRGIQRLDLLLDVLQERSTYNARRVLEEVLPDLLRQTGLTPVYRYLREAGMLKNDGTMREGAAVDAKIRARIVLGAQQFAVPTSSRPRMERIVAESERDLGRLVETQGVSLALASIPAIPHSQLNVDELRTFLWEQRGTFTTNINDRANWTRLVGLYDYLRFGLSR